MFMVRASAAPGARGQGWALAVLETAGLISRRRVAQLRPCKLEPERLKAVTSWLEQVQEIWEGNYKRLDALLAELKQTQKKERKT
jgi:hypothetical protein